MAESVRLRRDIVFHYRDADGRPMISRGEKCLRCGAPTWGTSFCSSCAEYMFAKPVKFVKLRLAWHKFLRMVGF